MIDELAHQIWARPRFQEDYQNLVTDAVCQHLGLGGRPLLESDRLRPLLQSASTFALSREDYIREAAYRITLAAWNAHKHELGGLSELWAFVLGRLGYFPSVELLRGALGDGATEPNSVSYPLQVEIAEHRLANEVTVVGGSTVTLTDFQRHLWYRLSTGRSVSVSAPTSAGKSFILQQYIGTLAARADCFCAVYVVPTRALVNQVAAAFTNVFNANGLAREVEVTSIPMRPGEFGSNKVLYVLTPERLHILWGSASDFRLGLIIIDESQSINDDSRGVVLQTAIDKSLMKTHEAQLLFAAPMIENPDVFANTFGLPDLQSLGEDECPVPQNLITVDFDLKSSNRASFAVLHRDRFVPLGAKDLPEPHKPPKFPIAHFAWELGKNDKNIVYASGPSECEWVAEYLAAAMKKKLNNESLQRALDFDPPAWEQHQEVRDFATFLRDHIHPKYLLADTVEYGVAFHYGNMPTLVRKTVEELFAKGRLQYIVCTSTLLHGINLPARNLFMHRPTKGKDWEDNKRKAITSIEFWNLAGRAGRLGKDFQGNVFLLNKSSWEKDPMIGGRKTLVEPALQAHLTKNRTPLIEFIKDAEHRSGREKTQGLENAFARLIGDERNHTLTQSLDRALGDSIAAKEEIAELIINVSREVKVPSRILDRNPTISPLRQQRMLTYLLAKIDSEGPYHVIPPHPERSWNAESACLDQLCRLFKRIHSQFEGINPADRSERYNAPLALKWMRGDPIARLISDAHRHEISNYKKRLENGVKAREPKLQKVIRDVMAKIEQDLRFRYVKFTHCYNDLLKEALRTRGLESHIAEVPDLPLFLELGASSQTMISFMSMNLSRSSAAALVELVEVKTLERAAAKQWLHEQDIERLAVPKTCLAEIRQIQFE